MKYFVPLAEDEAQAKRVETAVRAFIKENFGGFSSRRVFKLWYRDKGRPVTAEVGKNCHINDEPIIFIFYDALRDLYLVCTPSRGVAGGMPILVGGHEANSEDFNSEEDIKCNEEKIQKGFQSQKVINELSGKSGSFYLAVQCSGCDRGMLIAELPSSEYSFEDVSKDLEGAIINCLTCKNDTIVQARRTFVRGIR